MAFLLILLYIIIIFTIPVMIKIIWNVGIIALFNYFGITIVPITYGIAALIWLIWTFFVARSSGNNFDDDVELCKALVTKYLSMWAFVGIICIIVAIIF